MLAYDFDYYIDYFFKYLRPQILTKGKFKRNKLYSLPSHQET